MGSRCVFFVLSLAVLGVGLGAGGASFFSPAGCFLFLWCSRFLGVLGGVWLRSV
jgi:hypothetical protein